MPMPITPELAAFMRSLGYDQLRQAYKEKYGKPYPMFCLSETKISGAEYMEELRAQFPGEDLDELIDYIIAADQAAKLKSQQEKET